MAYDPTILTAPYGKARVVRYFRRAGQEFLESVDDFDTFSLALAEIFWDAEQNPDVNGMRRSWMVLGVFNDRGSPVYMQDPTKWPGNQWQKKEHSGDILSVLWKNYRKSESLVY